MSADSVKLWSENILGGSSGETLEFYYVPIPVVRGTSWSITMKLQIILAVVSLMIASCSAQAQQAMNFNDSPYNYQNSPYNYDNSAYNYSANNGVYDNSGNRIGYEVRAPSGVTNIYSNDGRRMGYVPAPQR